MIEFPPGPSSLVYTPVFTPPFGEDADFGYVSVYVHVPTYSFDSRCISARGSVGGFCSCAREFIAAGTSTVRIASKPTAIPRVFQMGFIFFLRNLPPTLPHAQNADKATEANSCLLMSVNVLHTTFELE